MPRYTTRVVQMDNWWEQPQPQLPQPSAWESGPVFTGLLDADGKPLYRRPEPVGYFDPSRRKR